MRRAGLTGLAVVLAAAFVAAQAKPDFSGSWTLDKEKSTMPAPPPGGGGGGGGGGRGGGGGAAEALTIKQTATELTITAGERVTVHKLDGTEYELAGGRGGAAKATSKWDGAKLVTSTSRTMAGRDGGEPMTITTTETRSLGADGTLVVDSVTKTPNGERTMKLVYKKG
jgi:hypothetical protein